MNLAPKRAAVPLAIVAALSITACSSPEWENRDEKYGAFRDYSCEIAKELPPEQVALVAAEHVLADPEAPYTRKETAEQIKQYVEGRHGLTPEPITPTPEGGEDCSGFVFAMFWDSKLADGEFVDFSVQDAKEYGVYQK